MPWGVLWSVLVVFPGPNHLLYLEFDIAVPWGVLWSVIVLFSGPESLVSPLIRPTLVLCSLEQAVGVWTKCEKTIHVLIAFVIHVCVMPHSPTSTKLRGILVSAYPSVHECLRACEEHARTQRVLSRGSKSDIFYRVS